MGTSKPNPARYGAMVDTIKAAMAAKKLTSASLAKKLGPKVPVPTVHGWLTYKNGPSDMYRKKLAKIFGIDETALITKPVPASAPSLEPYVKRLKQSVPNVKTRAAMNEAHNMGRARFAKAEELFSSLEKPKPDEGVYFKEAVKEMERAASTLPPSAMRSYSFNLGQLQPTTKDLPSISPVVEWHLKALVGSEVLISIKVPADAAQKLIDQLVEGKGT